MALRTTVCAATHDYRSKPAGAGQKQRADHIEARLDPTHPYQYTDYAATFFSRIA